MAMGDAVPDEDRAEVIRAYVHSAVGPSVALADGDNIFERQLVKSAFALQLVMYLERRFGIVVESEDLEVANFSSIAALTAFVRRKVATR